MIRFRYFFPVYRFLPLDVFEFKGLATHPKMRLKNLYRVTNRQDFAVPMNLWLFDPPAPFRWYQAIPVFGAWV